MKEGEEMILVRDERGRGDEGEEEEDGGVAVTSRESTGDKATSLSISTSVSISASHTLSLLRCYQAVGDKRPNE